MAANVLSEANLDKDEILKLAIELEGHPDNVAPCYIRKYDNSIYGRWKLSRIIKSSEEIDF